MSTIIISDIMERHIKNICTEYLEVAVRQLGTKYQFDADKAIAELDMPIIKRTDAPRKKMAEPKNKQKHDNIVPAIPLPFCGIINETWCMAIVKNNKLFTQCTNLKHGDLLFCNKCNKIIQKNGDLPFGNIQDRIKQDGDNTIFKDPKGVQVVYYSTVMKKLNITRETAENEAAKFGWTIPEEQFYIPEKSRGRPKKSDDEESTEDKKNAKRGRPKKDKPTKASSQVGDDIIAGLLAQANGAPSSEEEEEEEQDNDDSKDSQTHNTPTNPPAVAPANKMKNEKNPKQDKAAKAAEKEAAKAAKTAAKAAEKEAAKAAKAAAKAAEKEAAKAAKAAAKEAEKEANKTAKTHKEATKTTAKTDEEKETKAAKAVPHQIVKDDSNDIKKKEANPPNSNSSSEGEDEEEEDDEEEEAQEIKVKKFVFKGKMYKRSEPDNILYDWNDDEPVGVWNPKTNKIDPLPSDDDEEDDEE
jgi:hypothetical protein